MDRNGALRNDVRFTYPNGRVIEIRNSDHGKFIDGTMVPLDCIIELLDIMRDFVVTEL